MPIMTPDPIFDRQLKVLLDAAKDAATMQHPIHVTRDQAKALVEVFRHPHFLNLSAPLRAALLGLAHTVVTQRAGWPMHVINELHDAMLEAQTALSSEPSPHRSMGNISTDSSGYASENISLSASHASLNAIAHEISPTPPHIAITRAASMSDLLLATEGAPITVNVASSEPDPSDWATRPIFHNGYKAKLIKRLTIDGVTFPSGTSCLVRPIDDRNVSIVLYTREKNDRDEVTTEFRRPVTVDKSMLGSLWRAERYRSKWNKPLFKAPVSGDDICQGMLGDCFMLSGVAAIALQHPDWLQRNLMEDHGDGTVSVHLYAPDPADPAKSIKKTYRILKEVHHKPLAIPRRAYGSALWVKLLENAMALHMDPDQTKLGTPQVVLDGGKTRDVFFAITGKRPQELDAALFTTNESIYRTPRSITEIPTQMLDMFDNIANPQERATLLAGWVELLHRSYDATNQASLIHGMTTHEQVMAKIAQLGPITISPATVHHTWQSEARDLAHKIAELDTLIHASQQIIATAPADSPEAMQATQRLALNQKIRASKQDIFVALQALIARYLDPLPHTATPVTLAPEQFEAVLLANQCMPGACGTGIYSAQQHAIFDAIHNALHDHQCVGIGTRPPAKSTHKGDGMSGEQIIDGIAFEHAYAVVATRTDPDGTRWIQLRNPWGDTPALPFSPHAGRAYRRQKDGTLKPYGIHQGTFWLELSDVRHVDEVTIGSV